MYKDKKTSWGNKTPSPSTPITVRNTTFVRSNDLMSPLSKTPTDLSGKTLTAAL